MQGTPPIWRESTVIRVNRISLTSSREGRAGVHNSTLAAGAAHPESTQSIFGFIDHRVGVAGDISVRPAAR
jgi:hypothetical protein